MTRSEGKLTAYAAFIRAIGPESHLVMPQAALCAACDRLGFVSTRSFIASGNLYFKAALPPQECSKLVASAIIGFKLERPVFIRSASALDEIIAANPFPEAVRERPSLVSVSLFDDDFDEGLLAPVLAGPGPEKLVRRGKAIYVDYVAGQGRSKISPPTIERKLKRVGTARNWNTILRMRELLRKME